MHALVLYAHPEPTSLTASLAHHIAEGFVGAGATAEVADIAGEGFDPRYTEADFGVLRGLSPVPDDVRREQERVERADALVLVHPVYWWSMPSLMKGWLDRVLTFGWAFGTEEATVLADREVHLVRLGGNSPETYDKHGYREAMRAGVEHGIFEFAGKGKPVASSHLLHSSAEDMQTQVEQTVASVVAQATSAREALLVS